MTNNISSSFTTNIQVGVADLKIFSGLCSACTVILYVVTVSVNVIVFFVIMLKNLHEPMHLFFSNLLLNGIIVSSVLLPKLTIDILSENKTISPFGCYFQIFFIHIFVFNEQIILCVMAYDRYIAICNPLRYSQIMTSAQIFRLILFSWFFSIFACAVGITLCTRQPLCSFVIEKPFCDYYSVVKLLCSVESFYNYYALFATVITTAVPTAIILYSYIKIIQICLQKSKESNWKAFQTCFTHLLLFVIYVTGILFTFIQNRLPPKSVPQGLNAFLSLECLMVPPLANPVVYGLRTKQIRSTVSMLFAQFIRKTFTDKYSTTNITLIRDKQ
ncbi:olfactory receptor 52Z1-like [Protopterus annectens]|uniref:olfactory receptor 52Z1-like n=1 Tax=Protopterus annectens TaxID=7888 RepID=UPI001CFBCD5F|nr:olfactory receptor 52Z1-like [Protopterus annectens]